MLIKNGTVVTAEDSFAADVRIEGGLVCEIGCGLAPRDASEQVIDASGRLVLPGGVDAHTHMDLLVGTLRATDSFLTGSIAAACGGTTTIIDHMAFGPDGCELTHQIGVYHQLAQGKAVIDYGFHAVVDRVDDGILADLPKLIDEGVTSLKFYMTYDKRLDDEQIVRLLARAGQLGLLCCVHCENHATIGYLRQRLLAEGKATPYYHAISRPPGCEAEAVFRVVSLARAAGAPVYIVHTSAAASLEAVQALDAAAAVHGGATANIAGGVAAGGGPAPAARQALGAAELSPDEQALNGVSWNSSSGGALPPVIMESCPQYLVLDDSCYGAPDDHSGQGLRFVMSPPLRKPADQQALWQATADGRIEVIGTDHCPFYFASDKQLGAEDFSKCPNGIPGVELRLALMYSEGVVKRGLDVSRIVELCATAPAKRFGLYPQKGTIAVGSDADIVIFDPNRQVTVSHQMLHENVDYTPYEGLELTGYPQMTIARGQVIMEDGNFLGRPGQGKFLKRGLPQLG